MPKLLTPKQFKERRFYKLDPVTGKSPPYERVFASLDFKKMLLDLPTDTTFFVVKKLPPRKDAIADYQPIMIIIQDVVGWIFPFTGAKCFFPVTDE